MRSGLKGFGCVIGLFFLPTILAGCGSSGGGAPVNRSRVAVTMPGGISLKPESMNLVGTNATPIRPDGTCDYDNTNSTPNLLIVADKDGKPVLAGFSKPSSSTPQTINTRTTAVALLFFAIGAFSLPVDQHESIRTKIDEHPATEAFAARLDSLLASNPLAIANRDPQFLAAVTTATDALKSSRSRAASSTTVSPSGSSSSRQVTQSVLMTTEPSGLQGGIVLQNADDLSGLVITNTKRRNLMYQIVRTGFEDDSGKRTNTNEMVTDFTFPANWIPSTNKLAGAIGAIADVAVGNGAYQPVNTAPIPLGAQAKKTFYRVTIAGPGGISGATPKSGETVVKSAATGMLALSFTKDIFLPLLFAILDVKLSAEELLFMPSLFESSKGLMSIITGSGHVGIGLTSFHPKEVALSIFKTITDDYVFRQQIISWFTDLLVAKNMKTSYFIPAFSINQFATKMNFILAVIDKAMSLGDSVVTANDWGQSEYFNEWDVTVIKPTVKISPNTFALGKSEIQSLKAVTGTSVPTVFTWSTTGKYGELADAKGHVGKSFDSSEDQVSYICSKTPPNDGTDTDEVTVKVYTLRTQGGGSSKERVLLGEAKAVATISDRTEHGTVTVKISGADEKAGRFVSPSTTTYTLNSSTKTPSSLGVFISSLFRTSTPRASTFQLHSHFPGFQASSVPAKRENFAGSLSLWLTLTNNGTTFTQLFESYTGSINITSVVGRVMKFNFSARMAWDPQTGFSFTPGDYGWIDIEGTGETTVIDEKRAAEIQKGLASAKQK